MALVLPVIEGPLAAAAAVAAVAAVAASAATGAIGFSTESRLTIYNLRTNEIKWQQQRPFEK